MKEVLILMYIAWAMRVANTADMAYDKDIN